MPQYDLEWTSTPAERYDSGSASMNERAIAIVARKTGVPIDAVPTYGGSGSHTADNGLIVDVVDRDAAEEVAKAVAKRIGKRVMVFDSVGRTGEPPFAVVQP